MFVYIESIDAYKHAKSSEVKLGYQKKRLSIEPFLEIGSLPGYIQNFS
jgi:hypothetical protein